MCSFVRGVGCPSPLFCSGERAQRASRRAALAVSALRRMWLCAAWGVRGYGIVAAVQFGNFLAPRQREATDNCFPSLLCCPCAVWASQQSERNLLHAEARKRTDFAGDDRPRSPAGRLPRRAGPWGCLPRSRDGNARGATSRLWTAHRSSPTPPGPGALAQFRARNLTAPSILLPAT